MQDGVNDIALKLHIDILLWAASWSRSVQFLQQLYYFKALKVLYYLIRFCDDWSHKIAFDSILG